MLFSLEKEKGNPIKSGFHEREELNDLKNEKRAVSRRRTGLILHFLRGNAHLFLIALVFSMLNTVFNALTPQIIRITVDSIIGGAPAAIPGFIKGIVPEGIFAGSGMAALLLAAGAVLAVSILSGVSMYLSRMGLAKGTENFLKALRDRLYEHIQKLPFAWHVQHQTGEIIQRCTSDVDVIRNFVCNQLLEVIRTIFLIALYMSIMFTMNVKNQPDRTLFYPGGSRLFRHFLCKNCKAVPQGGRGRGRALLHRAGEPDRRACGAGIWPGSIRD